MEPSQNLLSSELVVDPIASAHLKETAMWARFLAIVGLVLSILIGILALFAGSILAGMSREFGNSTADAAIGSGIVTIIYLLVAALYFFISLYLFRFAGRMKLALLTTDQENFQSSLHNLKLVYRIMGIIMIVYLGILALVLIGGVLAAAFMN